MAALSFPLSGVVAFAGSRHGSPYPVVPVISAVLAAGGSVRVGCARGVDQSVRTAAPTAAVISALQFSALPPRAALARRTMTVVYHASALCLFPPASGVLGPGSTVALNTALNLFLPIWCAGVAPTSSNWQPHTLCGVSGWLWLPSQASLF